MESIHPVELITQQIIEQPLESLNLQLNKLYESQLLILNLLKNYELKLLHYSEISHGGQQSNQLQIKSYNEDINRLKMKLLRLSKMLDASNVRIDRVIDELVD